MGVERQNQRRSLAKPRRLCPLAVKTLEGFR
jgi:hypothetical protein